MDEGTLIYIVIPVYNRLDYTRQCLRSLYNQTYKGFNIIVIDDGSTDGTAEMLNNEFPGVQILKGDGNLWWTGAINLGIKSVLMQADDDDYVLTLNNDLYVQENYLQNLFNVISKKEKSLIGSLSIDADDHKKVLDAGVRINWKTAKFNNIANKLKNLKDLNNLCDLEPVDTLPGRGTMLPVGIFKEIGIFNEKFLPHYGADYEFAIRAKNNGYDLFVCNKAIVYSSPKETGLNNSINTISWSDYFKSYFSIKSPMNIKYRFAFARLSAPRYLRVSFFLLDLTRVIIGTLRNQLKFKKN